MKQNCVKKLLSIELSDSKDPEKPADVKERLQSMELLEEKLEVQRNRCGFGVIFTIAVYFLIWYNSECWALPFQESPCKRIRDLPLISTNQSTLAEAVDEFTLALQVQIAKLRDGIEISHLAERQVLSNATRSEIGQLFSRYSPDLVAFRALKREDERLREMEDAIETGYIHILTFLFIIIIFLYNIGERMKECNHPEKTDNQILSAEENENFQNSRLRQLKKRIPLLYIVTFICIALEVTLFFTFIAGHIYGGSFPIFQSIKWNADDCSIKIVMDNKNCNAKDNKNCTFTEYPSYATKLEPILNKQIGKLDNYTTSPIIEVRQMAWMYEGGVIDSAIEEHLHLKQYNVDRRTMPREIGMVLPEPFWIVALIIVSLLILFVYLIVFLIWAEEKGSINPQMTFDTKASKFSLKKKICFKTKINFKKIASVELSDSDDPENPADVKERLQKMELLEEKLKLQRNTCAFGIIFTVAVYFLIWYNTECWALPFQESPCKRTQPRALPLFATNQSTLSEAVDEFTTSLRAQFDKFRDGIQISQLAERQALSNATKNEIRKLFSNYSADLIAFAALKIEDASVRELDEAQSNGYATLILFLLINASCMGIMICCLDDSNMPQTLNKELHRQKTKINVRLKELRKQIPLQYIATFVCIAAAVMLFFTFTMGHYYSGSSPVFGDGCDLSRIKNGSQETKFCPFIHYRNFSTKLEAILNRHFGKLDSFMASPILEARQVVWLYESDGIYAAIENHLDLKQFNVDRRTMPPEIPQNPRYPPSRGWITFLLTGQSVAISKELPMRHNFFHTPVWQHSSQATTLGRGLPLVYHQCIWSFKKDLSPNDCLPEPTDRLAWTWRGKRVFSLDSSLLHTSFYVSIF
ncbi:hypothetical protein Ddc_10198 [Ditylenchus destructor]|nr:hypothetical protein Ddc_10198 [Ditylenchus destructor]